MPHGNTCYKPHGNSLFVFAMAVSVGLLSIGCSSDANDADDEKIDGERGATIFGASITNNNASATTYSYDKFGNLLQKGSCLIDADNYPFVDETTCNGLFSRYTTYTYSYFD